MKKLNLIFILFFLFGIQKSFCIECENYNGVQVYPLRNAISSNSAFLIDFIEKEFKIKGKLKDLEFTAISTTGKIYKLIILETNFSGSMGQFFLKPKSGIIIGDTISISISLKNKLELEGGINKLQSYIKWKKWVVKYKKYIEKPIWKRSGEEYQLFNYGTGLALELIGFSFSDNLYSELIKVKDYEWVPYYFRIEFINERFIRSGDHTTPRLFNGICNGNFTFENNKSYSAKLRVVDASGNFSKVSKIINFNTGAKVKPINTEAPYTTIPDPNFEKALIEKGYDSGTIDAKVPTANIANITYLEVSDKKISDLTGIQDFVALKTLICISNALKTLDISKNSALTTLWCFSNQLSFLDVSKNIALISLNCHSNQLSSLDVSKNTALTWLSCRSNQLSSLNIDNNKALIELYCFENQLNNFEVSNNIDLQILKCNTNKILALNTSKNVTLKIFECYSNQLTALDISQNYQLTEFRSDSNLLTNLNLSQNTLITQFSCSHNKLKTLYLAENAVLTSINCSFNDLY